MGLLTNSIELLESEKDRKLNIIWSPHKGSQTRFLSCPVFEVLIEGTRSGGKSDVLLMDFAQFVGKGYGEAWKGIIIRETYPNLQDIIAKSQKWFRKIFPDAKYNSSSHCWTFKDGEKLFFRHARTPQDYWNYHGHEYPWVGWEELTNWVDLELYEMMFSVCRSSFKDIPRHYRATCNPFGKGHNAVKRRFIDQAPPETLITDNESGKQRLYIHSSYTENTTMVENDPDYLNTLKNIKDPNKRKAWLEGSWDINAGGAIDDVWDRNIHVIEPFEIPYSWYIYRGFDWGSSAPFSVCWFAESNGDSVRIDGKWKTFPPKTTFLINELYGWNGTPNKGCKWNDLKIGKHIAELENGTDYGDRIYPGPADNTIFDETTKKEVTSSIHDDLLEGFNDHSEQYEDELFIKSDKRPGSRVKGLAVFRNYLSASMESPMENKGFFVFNNCIQFIRTVPTLPRSEKNIEDAATDGVEDHIYDVVRYALYTERQEIEILSNPW